MAEGQPEEEEEIRNFPCPLCPNAYKSARSLKRHLEEKHADDPHLQGELELVPKDTCPFCRQAFGNVTKHKRCCKSNPDVAKPTGVQPLPVPPHPYENLSNAEMVDKFADRLVRRLLPHEKVDCVRVLKQFIQHETSKDPEFRAFHWFVVGTRQKRDPRFRHLRIFSDYYEALCDPVRHTIIAYKHLNEWIGEKLMESWPEDDPLAINARNAASAKLT